MRTLTPEQAAGLIETLAPLIGVRGEVEGRTVELVEVMDEGPSNQPGVALMETGSPPPIQTNQYGNPLSRQFLTRTLPLLSEVDHDIHPVLRNLLPDEVVARLRALL